MPEAFASHYKPPGGSFPGKAWKSNSSALFLPPHVVPMAIEISDLPDFHLKAHFRLSFGMKSKLPKIPLFEKRSAPCVLHEALKGESRPYYLRSSFRFNSKEIKIVPEDCRNKSLAQAANTLEADKWQNLIFRCLERADVWLRNIQIHLGKTERLCFFIDSKIEVRNIYVMRHTKDVESQLSPLFIGVEAISTK